MTRRILFTTGAWLIGAAAAVWSLIWFPLVSFMPNGWGIAMLVAASMLGALASVLLSFSLRFRSPFLDRVRKRAALSVPVFITLFMTGLFILSSSPGPLVALFFFAATPALLVTVVRPVWGRRERNAAVAVGAYFLFNHVLWFFLGPLPVLQLTHAIASLALISTFTWPLLCALHDSNVMADRRSLPLPPPVDGGGS